jgi:FkbM family methyltransferase
MTAVESRLAYGELGPFEGAASDRVVLGSYERTGTWAPQLLTLLCEQLLVAGGTLLDGGAHIGLVSIPVARRTGAHALAFEPAPDNAHCLRNNVERHGLAALVEVHELALWDESTEASLRLSEHNGGDHRVRPGALAGDAQGVAVRCARLDEIVASRALRPPVVLKLDTQGSEVRALRGASATLAQVEHVVLEYFPAGLAELGNATSELDALLSAFPYATVLSQAELPSALADRAQLLGALSSIAQDGSDQGFFDLLVSKRPRVTARAHGTRVPR